MFNGKYLRKLTNEDGDVEVTFLVKDFQSKAFLTGLDKSMTYRFSATPLKSKRSLEQNRLLWSMIHEIAVARSGERANDDMDIYIEALEKSGAKCTYIGALPEIEDELKKKFRAIQLINSFVTEKGVTMNQYKVYYGSSTMNTQEMAKLLDTVLDMASQEGVYMNYE